MAIHSSLLTSAAPAIIGPDSALIKACNAFAALEIERQADGFTDEKDKAMGEALDIAFRQLFQSRATTIEGFKARARALAVYSYPYEPCEWPNDMMAVLLRDMLDLPDDVTGMSW